MSDWPADDVDSEEEECDIGEILLERFSALLKTLPSRSIYRAALCQHMLQDFDPSMVFQLSGYGTKRAFEKAMRQEGAREALAQALSHAPVAPRPSRGYDRVSIREFLVARLGSNTSGSQHDVYRLSNGQTRKALYASYRDLGNTGGIGVFYSECRSLNVQDPRAEGFGWHTCPHCFGDGDEMMRQLEDMIESAATAREKEVLQERLVEVRHHWMLKQQTRQLPAKLRERVAECANEAFILTDYWRRDYIHGAKGEEYLTVMSLQVWVGGKYWWMDFVSSSLLTEKNDWRFTVSVYRWLYLETDFFQGINTTYLLSDTGQKHYRNQFVLFHLGLIQRESGVQILPNFFENRHGESACDTHFGGLARSIRRRMGSTRELVTTEFGRQFYMEAISEYNRTILVEIPIDNSLPNPCRGAKGIQQYLSFYFLDSEPNVIYAKYTFTSQEVFKLECTPIDE